MLFAIMCTVLLASALGADVSSEEEELVNIVERDACQDRCWSVWGDGPRYENGRLDCLWDCTF